MNYKELEKKIIRALTKEGAEDLQLSVKEIAKIVISCLKNK